MAVGLVPTYESIGIWGTILLTIVRLIRGIGVGGEWGGSVLLAMEWARTNKNRGLLAAWPQFGGPAGLFLANLAVLFFSWLSGRPADPRILALALQCVEARVRSGLATGGSRIRTCMGVFLSSGFLVCCRFLVWSGQAVPRPVACDQVRGAAERCQGTEMLA